MLEIPSITKKGFGRCCLCRGFRDCDGVGVFVDKADVVMCWRHYRLLAEGILVKNEFDEVVRCRNADLITAAELRTKGSGPPEEDIPF